MTTVGYGDMTYDSETSTLSFIFAFSLFHFTPRPYIDIFNTIVIYFATSVTTLHLLQFG